MSSNRDRQLLGFGIQKYTLCLDNRNIEDASDDSPQSSASDFQVQIQPTLDLSTLLFLKSTDAEVSLNEITIDNSCLTFKTTESIKCYFRHDTEQTLSINWLTNHTVLNDWNETPMLLDFYDYSAQSNTDAIDYINSLLERNINFRIVYGYLLNFFDTNIFVETFLKDLHTDRNLALTKEEFRLVVRWIDIALFIRKVIYEALVSLIDEPTAELFTFTYASNRSTRAEGFDTQVLNDSSNLRKTHESARDGKIIDFPLFSGIDLTKTADVAEKITEIKKS